MSCHSGVGCVFRACKPQSGGCSMRRANLHPLVLCVKMLREGPLRVLWCLGGGRMCPAGRMPAAAQFH